MNVSQHKPHTPNLDALEAGRAVAFEKYRCECERLPKMRTPEHTAFLKKHGTLCRKQTIRGWRRSWQCNACLRNIPGDGVNAGPSTMHLPVYILPGDPRREQARDRRLAVLEEARAHLPSKREAWFRDHDLYLKTDKWKALRRAALERDRHECRCGQPAEHVHHLTYERWQNENLDDLVSLCAACHEKEHEG